MSSISLLTNTAALGARRHLEQSGAALEKSIERLSSGKRINHAGDDAAGLSISSSLDAKVRSIQQANRNANEALSLAQVAEGGMNDVSNMVTRMRELAIQAASDTISDKEREILNMEGGELKSEIDRLAETTRYFNTALLNGSSSDFQFQIGIENTEADRISYQASQIDVRTDTLGLDGVDFSSKDNALDTLGAIDDAFHKIAMPRAMLGAFQNRLTVASNNLMAYEENMTAAKGRILDADLASETTNIVKGQVLRAAGASVLTQANQLPATALKLIG